MFGTEFAGAAAGSRYDSLEVLIRRRMSGNGFRLVR